MFMNMLFCFSVFSYVSLILASVFIYTHLRNYQGHVPVFRQASSTSHLSQQQLL